mmetsp:Transcript_26040/g.66123  ORF Transcript_26040/g.66123 Transcript_26040/m.66123 type:complete len:385 (-) Transcript_26040:5374-6528(-)
MGDAKKGDLFDDVFDEDDPAADPSIKAAKGKVVAQKQKGEDVRALAKAANSESLRIAEDVEVKQRAERAPTSSNSAADAVADIPPEEDEPTDIIFLVFDFVEGPFRGERFEIGQEGTAITRNGITPSHARALREMQLPDPDVSRRHASILFEDKRYWIQDVGSLNGTFINGERLSKERKVSKKRRLDGGEVLQLGGSRVKVMFRVVMIDEMIDEQRQSLQRLKRKKDRFARQLKKRMRMAAVPKPVVEDAGQIPVRKVKMETLSYRDFQNLSRVISGQSGAGLGISGLSGISSSATTRLLPNTHMLLNLVEDVRIHNDKLRDEQREDEERREKLRQAEMKRRKRGRDVGHAVDEFLATIERDVQKQSHPPLPSSLPPPLPPSDH